MRRELFPLEGGCDCRSVRYRVAAPPLIVHCCHCRWCQRESGAAFALNAMIEASLVTHLAEEPELVDTPSESGRGQKIARCPRCRIAVWSYYPGAGPSLRFVRVGTLDTPDALPPDIHIYTSSKQPWVVIPDGMPTVSEYYEREDYWSAESLARRRAILPEIEAYQATLSREGVSDMKLYAHPFSSYCQKVLIALYENDIPFEFRMLAPEHEQNVAEQAALWPLKRMPVLADGNRTVVEASIIIEYLDLDHPGPVKLVPANRRLALDVRMMDRFFDNYVMTPMQKIVADHIRAPENRDAQGVAEARGLLDTAYAWLDRTLEGREWASGDAFSLADCAAAPSLFYADWVRPIAESYPTLRAYRRRLLARPSFARAVDEARPYRTLFPPGAPDRD